MMVSKFARSTFRGTGSTCFPLVKILFANYGNSRLAGVWLLIQGQVLWKCLIVAAKNCLHFFIWTGTTGKQEYEAQAVFNHTEDYVLFPDEATTSLCAWNSRNASRKQLMSLGHNGAVRLIAHSPTQASFLTCSDDFRARFWYRRTPTL